MSETFVLALSAALALATVVGTGWAMWRITRHDPSRHRALSYVLWSVTGTTLMGVILPAIVMGMVDPFPIWMVQATFTSATAAALGGRGPARPREPRDRARVAVGSVVLVLALALAGVAVT